MNRREHICLRRDSVSKYKRSNISYSLWICFYPTIPFLSISVAFLWNILPILNPFKQKVVLSYLFWKNKDIRWLQQQTAITYFQIGVFGHQGHKD